MRTISCRQCGAKLNVKEEFGGKKVRCPQCKHAVAIPAVGGLEGVALPSRPAPSHADSSANVDSTESLTAEAHLSVAGEIARGGMGVIMRAVDRDIHREVAVKFLLNHADARQKARFVEEAQITGQLQHPNIVPIHQLGVHENGRCFFSMKMVKGRSLAEILKDSGNGYTMSRMLGVFVSICNAIAYAHSRQVIHRDLKPANIMVGDFGEVYVMDWGLAKVLGKDAASPPTASPTSFRIEPSQNCPAIKPADSKSNEKVTIHRTVAGDLTQAGAILGTPAYMPPEQAKGEEDVDQRSDIYSLGAILYEIMTLTPPVGRGGDMMAILMRIIDGKIDPPAERAPERAKAGWIPPELAAVATKALRANRADRYPSVEALKRDIELFLEGRSVSAKQDSALEMFKKLVRRNKAVSIATAAALALVTVVGGIALKINHDARVAAVNAEKQKQETGRKSVPAFVNAARQAISENRFDDARDLIAVALDFNGQSAPARLVKVQLFLADLDFDNARGELAEALKIDPNLAEAKSLVALAATASVDDATSLLALADEMSRQKSFSIVDRLTQRATALLNANNKLLEPLRKRIESAWPGAGPRLLVVDNDKLELSLEGLKARDLAPLKGMPITRLNLTGCPITSLDPIKGMKLTNLNLSGCNQLRDLEPIRGMKITILNVSNSQIKDWSPLEGMPLDELTLNGCPQLNDLSPFKRLPLTKLSVVGSPVTDLRPIQGMKLNWLTVQSAVVDLGPLKGMPLKNLTAISPVLTDLSPLQDMPLVHARFNSCFLLRDLTPLRGMPLESLELYSAAVDDLSPLEKMPLTVLSVANCRNVDSLKPLKHLLLTKLLLTGCAKVSDLTPLRDMPLVDLNINSCVLIDDLTPLRGLKLTNLDFSAKHIVRGIDVVRDMPSMVWIGNGGSRMPPREFWKRYDAGEFK